MPWRTSLVVIQGNAGNAACRTHSTPYYNSHTRLSKHELMQTEQMRDMRQASARLEVARRTSSLPLLSAAACLLQCFRHRMTSSCGEAGGGGVGGEAGTGWVFSLLVSLGQWGSQAVRQPGRPARRV